MTIQPNDYDPLLPNEDGQTPSWSEIFRLAADAAARDLHTWLPAVVVLVRPTGTVDLQPLLLRRYAALPAPVPLPIIQNCLVQQPRGATYGMKLPVAVGDTGAALFCERSLDVWSVSGGAVDPLDTRTHDLSDAIFVPGVYPVSQPVPPPMGADPTELVVYNGLAQLYLQKTGAFKATNGAPASELLTIVLQALTQLQTGFAQLAAATTATMIGPQPLSVAPALLEVATALSTLVTAVTPLVGV